MMATDPLRQLSADHCVLLAATYASESNLDGLRALLRSRRDAFDPELALRILLTYLPETTDPALYTSLVAEVAGIASEQERHEDTAATLHLDTSSVKELSDSKAYKAAKHLHLVPLDYAPHPAARYDDLTARFLVHRAHRIADVGTLTFVPLLLDPFLDDRPLLKTWFISNVLPLLRFGYEYYTEDEDISNWSIDRLENANSEEVVAMLLSKSLMGNKMKDTESSQLARDIRCLVGPWIYGANERKRRKVSGRHERRPSEYNADSKRYGNELEDELSGDQKMDDMQEQWDNVFTLLTRAATQNLHVVTEAMQVWDGPSDLDLGGYHTNSYMDDEVQRKLEVRYAQTVFAAIYAADSGSREAIQNAHALLVRIANLMDFEPPPDLGTSVDMLPQIDDKKSILHNLTSSVLQPDALLDPQHPLTNPTTETFTLLQLFVFSSYLFLELNNPLSIVAGAKVRFQYDADEQMALVTRILHSLTIASSAKRDNDSWASVRSRLIWLWGWALARKDEEDIETGHGIFGKIERGTLEKEILKSLLNAGAYPLIVKTYIQNLDVDTCLTIKDTEQVILSTALQLYDNASNGNRTRGAVKKAADIVAAFRSHFSASDAFTRCESLLAATHALSFYKLTLQHGVPFQPVNIRVSEDPVALIEKVLAQNPRSYTKLDDLISIATNLVASGVGHGMTAEDGFSSTRDFRSPQRKDWIAAAKRKAERRVIGMAIDAALNEDDFETAYSYVVNRLATTSSLPSSSEPREMDDISWRAALAAGRHKSTSASHTSLSTNVSTPPKLRRLEQRMELLSQTLLLAPSTALPDVLNVWRKCEEEMSALQLAEAAEDEAFNRHAERAAPPGAFESAATLEAVQPRREIGRGGKEEAPMGLFDVARGAAAAFSRTAFPLSASGITGGGRDLTSAGSRAGIGHARGVSSAESDAVEGDSESRVRKRDMVASAVTGGLASGIGWVIGATPTDRQQR